MEDRVIARDEEGCVLKDCYESDHSEFVAVYGRRRVGKTFLVKELFARDGWPFTHPYTSRT